MPDSAEAAWLRHERENRSWTKMEMVRLLLKTAREADDTSVPDTDGMRRNVYRWEREGGVSERYRLHYCRTFGIDPSEYGPDGKPRDTATTTSAAEDGTTAPPALPALPGVADPLLSAIAAMIYRGGQEPGLGDFAVGQEVAMTGHESSGHAAEHEPYDLGETTFEQLRADVVRLARLTETGAPLPVFRDLRRVRDRIHLLLDRRLLLSETSGLYFLLGCVNVLLGANANRLGYPGTAEELLRAGWTYATIIEHDPLRARVRAYLSEVLYHRGQYSQSRDLAADGLRYVSQGQHGAELHSWHAHAAARLGDLDTARQSVALAYDARDADHNDDLLEIGGEFIISRATHQSLAGRALTEVSGAERDAAEKLEEAIGLYDAGPGPGEEFWFAGKPMAGANLAIIRLRSGALDAAAAALEPALALPAEQRISEITGSLADVRRELAAPIFQGSPQARDLGDQIEAFGRDTVTSVLHSLTG